MMIGDKFRNFLTIIFLLFLLGWFYFVFHLLVVVGIDAVEALSVGTATGIFLKAFSDTWQFYYRKAPKLENKDAG